MSHEKQSTKKGPVDLSARYKRRLEKSIFFSLFFFCFIFYSFPMFENISTELKMPELWIDFIVPPIIDRPKPPVKPKPPAIPVEADADELLDEVVVDFLAVQEDWMTNTPTKPTFEDTTEVFDFIAVSEKPKLLKVVAPIYPELAQQAGITGVVVVKVLIDKKGDIEKAEILKSLEMLDEAALAAAWQLKFKPGKQRDKFVKVWMSVPFRFKN